MSTNGAERMPQPETVESYFRARVEDVRAQGPNRAPDAPAHGEWVELTVQDGECRSRVFSASKCHCGHVVEGPSREATLAALARHAETA